MKYRAIRIDFALPRLCHCLPLLLVGLAPAPLGAIHGEPGFWSLQLENDLWGSNDDRFYTNGWQFSYTSSHSAPEILESTVDAIPFYRSKETGFFGFNFGQKIFTPEDIEVSELQVDDRPYAGLLFAEAFIGHRYLDLGDRERMNGLILTLGLIGPVSLAEETQEFVHAFTDSDNPDGWDNQLENELGINAYFVHKQRRIFDMDEARQSEIGLHYGLSLGNIYRYASAGTTFRWGPHLKDDIGPPSLSPGFPGLPAFNPNRRSNWYLFIGLEARAVAHDIFLDGNTNVDSHSVDKRELVGDLQLGFAIHLEDVRISFSQMLRSREFESQPERTQFGAINFTLFVE